MAVGSDGDGSRREIGRDYLDEDGVGARGDLRLHARAELDLIEGQLGVLRKEDGARLSPEARERLLDTRRVSNRLRARSAPIPANPGARARSCEDAAAAELLARIRAVVDRHLDDEGFDAAGLARGLGMSRATLYRRLSGTLGHSAMHVIRGMRLDHAALLLRTGNPSVSEVAFSVGFRSLSRFSACFRERFGVCPTEFRARPVPAGPRHD